MTRTAMPMAQEAELPLTAAELDVCRSFFLVNACLVNNTFPLLSWYLVLFDIGST